MKVRSPSLLDLSFVSTAGVIVVTWVIDAVERVSMGKRDLTFKEFRKRPLAEYFLYFSMMTAGVMPLTTSNV